MNLCINTLRNLLTESNGPLKLTPTIAFDATGIKSRNKNKERALRRHRRRVVHDKGKRTEYPKDVLNSLNSGPL